MALYPEIDIPLVEEFMELVDRSVLGSSAAGFSFTGISTAYKMFEINSYIVEDGTGSTIVFQFNGDTGNNYETQRTRVESTNVTASRSTGGAAIAPMNVGIDPNRNATISCYLAKPLASKPANIVGGVTYQQGGPMLFLFAGQWNNSADAITRIDVLPGSGTWAAGTAITVLGDRHAA